MVVAAEAAVVKQSRLRRQGANETPMIGSSFSVMTSSATVVHQAGSSVSMFAEIAGRRRGGSSAVVTALLYERSVAGEGSDIFGLWERDLES